MLFMKEQKVSESMLKILKIYKIGVIKKKTLLINDQQVFISMDKYNN